MITFRKRAIAASVPAIIGTALLATALGAAETLSDDSSTTSAGNPAVTMTEDAAANGKGDLKVDLADIHSRPMRCVSGEGTTTCTGWPVAGGMLAYAD